MKILHVTMAAALALGLSTAAMAQEHQDQQAGQQAGAQANTQAAADVTITEPASGIMAAQQLSTQFGGRFGTPFAELDADQSGGLTVQELVGEEEWGGLDAEQQTALETEFQGLIGEETELNEQAFGEFGTAIQSITPSNTAAGGANADDDAGAATQGNAQTQTTN